MLGWIISILAAIVTFFNSLMSVIKHIPETLAFTYELVDFIHDMIQVQMAELISPLPILFYLFITALIIRIIIEIV